MPASGVRPPLRSGLSPSFSRALTLPAETVVSRHSCPAGLGAELWTIQGADHIPPFATPTWPEAITTWLFQFHKP